MNVDFDFQYKWPIGPDILVELASGFDEVLHDYDPVRKLPAHIIRFSRKGKCIVEVLDQMYDLDDRLEIGVLQFRREKYTADSLHREVLDPSFSRNVSASKLIIEEQGSVFASGIRFRTDSGLELTVASGSLPYSIAIGIPGHTDDSLFTPEYFLNRYLEVPLSSKS